MFNNKKLKWITIGNINTLPPMKINYPSFSFSLYKAYSIFFTIFETSPASKHYSNINLAFSFLSSIIN
jgi:hypothetical protein